MGQLLCSVNLTLVLLKWTFVLAWGGRQILAFLPPFMKTVDVLGKGVKTSANISFSKSHSQQSAKMQKQF